MRVSPGEHVGIRMSHQYRNCDWVDAFLECVRRPSVAHRVQAKAFFQFTLERVEAAIDRHRCPRFVAAIPKQFSTPVTPQPTLRDFEGSIVQVDDSMFLASLGFLRREDPATICNVDVSMFYAKDFLRAC